MACLPDHDCAPAAPAHRTVPDMRAQLRAFEAGTSRVDHRVMRLVGGCTAVTLMAGLLVGLGLLSPADLVAQLAANLLAAALTRVSPPASVSPGSAPETPTA